MRILSVGRALPPHRYTQEEICAELAELWSDRRAVVARLPALRESSRVATRHLALPLDAYASLLSFGDANDAWIEHALDLGERALSEALDLAGLEPGDVDAVISTSVTGVASPSIEARLMNRVPLREDVKRVPVFGLGCVAGAAGIARAADYVRAFPDQVAVVLAVELCSLTFQSGDLSLAHVISATLFGDGAAAVVVAGERRARAAGGRGPAVRATRSFFYRDTEDVMGWRISEHGFEIVLSPAVPEIARARIGADADRFLGEHELRRSDVRRWICHPGGPKVLAAIQEALGLSDGDVAHAWRVLESQGNISSVSVLMVLAEVMDRDAVEPGELGVLLAMGPAFCSELVLLEW